VAVLNLGYKTWLRLVCGWECSPGVRVRHISHGTVCNWAYISTFSTTFLCPLSIVLVEWLAHLPSEFPVWPLNRLSWLGFPPVLSQSQNYSVSWATISLQKKKEFPKSRPRLKQTSLICGGFASKSESKHRLYY
jgi:hypothetical protein